MRPPDPTRIHTVVMVAHINNVSDATAQYQQLTQTRDAPFVCEMFDPLEQIVTYYGLCSRSDNEEFSTIWAPLWSSATVTYWVTDFTNIVRRTNSPNPGIDSLFFPRDAFSALDLIPPPPN